MQSLPILLALALGQVPAPKINYVYPAGGKAGTVVNVTVAGENLDAPEGLWFSFPGAKVEPLGPDKLPDTPVGKGNKGMAGPPPKAAAKFQITLPANAPAGVHDVRVVSKVGVSNPRAFVIGELPEELEKEPNDDVPQANKVPMNVSINGVIDRAIDVDYFQVAGKKGQRLVAACQATSIESRLPAQVEIFDMKGARLAQNRGYQNYDAVADAILPEDGDYLVRISSFTHTVGGPDFVYRLTLGTMPWIDAVSPVAVEPGKSATLEVLGRNLPGGKLVPDLLLEGRPLERATITVKAPSGDKAEQRLDTATLVFPASSVIDGFDLRMPMSNAYLLALSKSPVATETEPNDAAEKATLVKTPVQVSGRIDRKNDVDWFRFEAKKDVPLAIELFADRLNSAPVGAGVDLKFVVLGPKGTIVTTQDDNPEIMAQQFFARTDDPVRFRLAPTEDGPYTVGVSSADGTFSPRHVYTMRIAPEDGDFRVVAMPASNLAPDSAVAGAQGHYGFNVFVWRLGNFTGDVTITADKLPPGVSVKPQVISAAQKQSAVVVSIADNAPEFTGAIDLIATGEVNGQKKSREVRAATITYPVQQAAPVLARLDRGLVLAIRDKAKYSLTPSSDKITILQGEKINLGLTLKPLSPDFKGTVTVTGFGLPTGIIVPPATITGDKETPVPIDYKGQVTPGVYTLVFRGQTAVPPKQGQQPPKNGPPNFIEYVPPITLTVVPKQILKITPPTATLKIERGKDAEASIQVSKLFPFAGAVEIDVDPASAKGVHAAPVKLQLTENDTVKLKVSVDQDAPTGMFNVTVRAVTRFADRPISHEAKMAVMITK